MYSRIINNFMIGLIFLFILYIGAGMRFHKAQFPLMVPDSGGYFSTSAQYFINGEIKGYCVRSLPYPLILLSILLVFKNMSFRQF